MLSINDLAPKMILLIDGHPYQLLEVKRLHMGRGGSSVQTRIRNLTTGQVFSRNFKPADSFAEADIEKRELIYLYHHRGEYVLAEKDHPQQRYTLNAEQLGDASPWLKPATPVTAIFVDGALASVTPPIKVELKVTEAPPGLRGDTVSGATKEVTLETGTKIQVPLFVNEGDVVRVNTETGEYAERVNKAPEG